MVGLGLGAGHAEAQVPPCSADSPSAPVNVTVRHLKANSAVVSWDVLEDEVIIGFAISQQVTLEGSWEERAYHDGDRKLDASDVACL